MHGATAVVTLVNFVEVPFAQSLTVCEAAGDPGALGDIAPASLSDEKTWGGLLDVRRGTASGSHFCADKGLVVLHGQTLEVHAKTCTKVAGMFGGLVGASMADRYGRRLVLMLYLAVTAISTLMFAAGAGDPSTGAALFLVGNFLQGFTDLTLLIQVFDADLMQRSEDSRITKLMLDSSRSLVQFSVTWGGAYLLHSALFGSPRLWLFLWLTLTAFVLALLVEVFLVFPEIVMPTASAEGVPSGAVAAGSPPPDAAGGAFTFRGELAKFRSLLQEKPEARAYILTDCLRAMVERAQIVERSIIMLLFDLRFSDWAYYLVGLPLLFHLCAPLVPLYMDRVGHRRGFIRVLAVFMALRIVTTLMLPLGQWMVPFKIYVVVPFAGLGLVNFDIMQRVFLSHEQAKLQSLNATFVQIVGVLADYMYLWLLNPNATSYFGLMRPLLVACCLLALQWLCCMRHPGWKWVREHLLDEMGADRKRKEAAREKSD